MHAFQIPISMRERPSVRIVAHHFVVSSKTDVLVPSLCNKQFNPGFAIPYTAAHGATAKICIRCEKKLTLANKNLSV